MSTRAPYVTVLTAARNARRFLPDAVQSIQRQTYDDWEYVIVNDASEDDTGDIVERLARTDDRIRALHRSSCGGPFVAANDGLRVARGKYIVQLDSDDLAVPHRIERQLAYLEARPRLRACAALVQVLTDDGLRDHGVGRLPTLVHSMKWRVCVRPGLAHSSACVERSALLELGGYGNLRLSEDLRLWCQLARFDWLGVVPEVLVYWRSHDGQLTKLEDDELEWRAIEVVREHLSELSGENWASDDVARLYSVGLRPMPLRAGLDIISRFDSAWRRDSGLTPAERRELRRLVRRVRFEHIRAVARDRVEFVPASGPFLRLWRRLKHFASP